MKTFLSIFIIGALFLQSAFAGEPLKASSVVDGETVRLNDGRILKLIGVSCEEGQLVRSQVALKGLIGDKTLRTQIDPANALLHHHDAQQRFLAYLYVDDLFVNEEMIRQGYCHAEKKYSYRYKSRFLAIENQSKTNSEEALR